MGQGLYREAKVTLLMRLHYERMVAIYMLDPLSEAGSAEHKSEIEEDMEQVDSMNTHKSAGLEWHLLSERAQG